VCRLGQRKWNASQAGLQNYTAVHPQAVVAGAPPYRFPGRKSICSRQAGRLVWVANGLGPIENRQIDAESVTRATDPENKSQRRASRSCRVFI